MSIGIDPVRELSTRAIAHHLARQFPTQDPAHATLGHETRSCCGTVCARGGHQWTIRCQCGWRSSEYENRDGCVRAWRDHNATARREAIRAHARKLAAMFSVDSLVADDMAIGAIALWRAAASQPMPTLLVNVQTPRS